MFTNTGLDVPLAGSPLPLRVVRVLVVGKDEFPTNKLNRSDLLLFDNQFCAFAELSPPPNEILGGIFSKFWATLFTSKF